MRAVSDKVIFGVTVGMTANGFLKGQLRWLGSQGWVCSLAATPDDKAIHAAQREGVSFYSLPMSRTWSPKSDLVSFARWLRLIRRVKPRAVNVSTPKAGFLGAVAAFILRVPKRVYVMRGLRLEGARGVMKALLWLAERITVACSTDVVFVSPSLALAVSERHLGGSKKGWLIGYGSSNGVDVERVRYSAISAAGSVTRESLSLAKTDFVVGFVGRIAMDKGVDTLIRAFQDWSVPENFKLLVVGETEDFALRSRLNSLGDRVRVTGQVNNVPAHMAIMDALCLPTRREGFPNVVLEAGAMQLPVVATKATGSVDAVVDDKTGLLVDIDDDQGLVRAMRTLADDPARARMMGMNGYERALRDFNPTRIWSGVLAILNSDYGATDLHPVSELYLKNNQKES